MAIWPDMLGMEPVVVVKPAGVAEAVVAVTNCTLMLRVALDQECKCDSCMHNSDTYIQIGYSNVP